MHRDLKPQNILIADNGDAKISDMGLSRRRMDTGQSHVISKRPGGTSGWKAPELLLEAPLTNGSFLGKRSMDVFSLGCVLHYTITGGGPREVVDNAIKVLKFYYA